MSGVIEKAGSGPFVVSGELTIYQANAVAQGLKAAQNEGALRDVDLADVSEIDTAGLQILLAARDKAADLGERLLLRNPGPAVLEVLALAGLSDAFEVAGAPDTEGAP